MADERGDGADGVVDDGSDGIRGLFSFSRADEELTVVVWWRMDGMDDEFYERTYFCSISKIVTALATVNYRRYLLWGGDKVVFLSQTGGKLLNMKRDIERNRESCTTLVR
jgi:hypothetical protein